MNGNKLSRFEHPNSTYNFACVSFNPLEEI